MNSQKRFAGVSLMFCLSLSACADEGAAPGVPMSRDDAGVADDVSLTPSRLAPSAGAIDYGRAGVTFAPPVETVDARMGREARDTALRVIDAVARRQITPLEEGTYAVDTWEAAAANRAPRGVVWNYPWGVTLYGMLRASAVTGDRTWADFVTRHNALAGRTYGYLVDVNARYGATHRREVDDMLRRAPVLGAVILGSLDNCGAMSAQLLEGAQGATLSRGEAQLMSAVGDYISSRQSRLPDGAFWRPEWAQTLWIDDLFMSCPFLVRWARQTGDRRHLDDAARQIITFARRQQDRDGLWFHASFVGADRVAPFKWGRANGWAMVATVEVLSAMPEDHPDRARVLDILRRHIDGVKRLQAPSGRWRQVLDQADLWEETSCTAMFTYSIARAVSRGWIPREDLAVALRGMRGLGERVGDDGSIRDVCEGTVIGQDLGYYATRAHPINDVHGPGPVLLAASEVVVATETR